MCGRACACLPLLVCVIGESKRVPCLLAMTLDYAACCRADWTPSARLTDWTPSAWFWKAVFVVCKLYVVGCGSMGANGCVRLP